VTKTKTKIKTADEKNTARYFKFGT